MGQKECSYLVEVHNGVEDSGSGKDPEHGDGRGHGGVGEHVEGPSKEEEEDVLHIVEVGAPHSLNVIVLERHLGLAVGGGILLVGKDLDKNMKVILRTPPLLR